MKIIDRLNAWADADGFDCGSSGCEMSDDAMFVLNHVSHLLEVVKQAQEVCNGMYHDGPPFFGEPIERAVLLHTNHRLVVALRRLERIDEKS